MTDGETTRKPASLNKALKLGFRGAYDSLGYVVGASFAAFIASAVVFTVMGLIGGRVRGAGPVGLVLIVPGLLAAWLCAVGIFYYVRKVIYHEHPAPADTWEGIRKLAVPAFALFVVDLLVTTLLVGDLAFFGLAFRAKGGVAFAALAIISAYIALMWLLMSLYHLPVMVAQLGMESGPRVKKILYKSFLLTADNPGFTVGLFVVIIAFATLCALPAMLGMALLFPGAAAFLLTYSLRELFIRYGVVEEEPEIVEDKPWKLNS
jgi:hypothetical protein